MDETERLIADLEFVRSHIFYASRTVDIRDGLPKWTGLDGQSDLIEDSPPEAVEEWRKKVEERENEE